MLACTTAVSPGDSLYGTVKDGLSHSPLAGARVEVMTQRYAGTTSNDGQYALPTSAPGPHSLRVTRSGYDTVLVDAIIYPGQSLRVDVALHRLPTRLPAIEVSTIPAQLTGRDSIEWRNSNEIGLRTYSPESFRRDPLVVEPDPILAIAGGAGSGAPAEFPSTLHLRGGSADQNLVLLDGLPVYGLGHLGGAGSIFNPDMVSRVDLHPTRQPASLAGRLSSAIAVTLRQSANPGATMDGGLDRTAAWLTAGLTSSDRSASALLSGRRSYRGVLTQTVGDNAQANGFEDYLGRGSLVLGRDRIDLYLLTSLDQLAFSATSQDNPVAVDGAQAAGESPTNRFDWSNHTGGLVWRHTGAPGRELAVRAWHSGSRARIDWSGDSGGVNVNSALSDLGASAELVTTHASFHRTLELSAQWLDVTYKVGGMGTPVVGGPGPAGHISPVILGASMEEQRRLSQELTMAMGVRANAAPGFKPTVAPSVSGRWAVSPSFTVLLEYDRKYQYLQSMRNEESILGYAFGADLPAASGQGSPARADQLSAGLETHLGRTTTARVEGYTRWLDHLAIIPAATAAPFAVGPVPSGSGEARGIELDLTHHRERFDARLAVGLADTRRMTGLTEFSPGAGRSHWLSAGLRYHAAGSGIVGLTGSYASGSPTSVLGGDFAWQSPGGLASAGEISGTPQTTMGGLNTSRLPPYVRVDLGVSRDWLLGTAARPRRLTTSLTITNLFDHRNALGLSLDPSRRSIQTLLYPGRALNGRAAWHF
ncbi:MAG TPA: TonB-dependent receptor [Gemmatimonadales bacterium]